MSRVFSSPSRVFGSSNAVRFVSADGAAYEPPVLYSPSDPPVLLQRSSPAREHSPWLRGGTSVGGESTSPGTVKRARSPGFLQRDSLKSRYSPGRPGSRRHQRWSNDQALREDLTDDDLRALYAMDWRSALSELFEGDDKMQKWQDFCSAPEEEQRKILYGIHKAAPTTAKRALVPRERYDRIDRRVKTLLKRGVGKDFVAAFENRLCQLLYAPDEVGMATQQDFCNYMAEDLEVSKTKGGASLVLNDSMHRLLAHAVCLYHEVQSFTRECDGNLASSGSKKLIMLWPHTVAAQSTDPQSSAPLESPPHPNLQQGAPHAISEVPLPRVGWGLHMPDLTLQQLIAA